MTYYTRWTKVNLNSNLNNPLYRLDDATFYSTRPIIGLFEHYLSFMWLFIMVDQIQGNFYSWQNVSLVLTKLMKKNN